MNNTQAVLEKDYRNMEVENKNAQEEKFMEWETAKDKICMRVIGPKQENDVKPKAFLIRFLNLSIMIYAREDGCNDKILIITKEDVRMWGVPEEEIVYQAFNNTKKNSRFVLKNLAGYLCDMLPYISESERNQIESAEKNPVYVLSTMSGSYGASSILFTDIFQKVCEDFGCNLFILPSSVHELILVPDRAAQWSSEELLQVVKDVNRTVTEDKSLLADNVYYYDRKVGKVEIAA